MAPRIVGITGIKGSGKSTCAEYLFRQHHFAWRSFAYPIKEMLSALGVGEDHLYGDLKEAPIELLCGRSARHAMQTLGTEWGRNCIHPDIWVRIALHRARQTIDDGRGVVIDDVRFPNECAAITAAGGVVLRILRPGIVAEDHASECQVEGLPVKAVLVNGGSVLDLQILVRDALELPVKFPI